MTTESDVPKDGVLFQDLLRTLDDAEIKETRTFYRRRHGRFKDGNVQRLYDLMQYYVEQECKDRGIK